MIKFDFSTYTDGYLNNENYNQKISEINELFLNHGQMKGWYDLDVDLDEIISISHLIKEQSDIFIVIGIGGSYLGAKAIIEALSPYFKKSTPEILFAGYNLSSDYLTELLEHIKDKRITINVISKSGGTIEPNIAFDKIYQYMQSIYTNDELKKRVIITTDATTGKLIKFANTLNCKKFYIPSNIGGRYSVLTPVGLLPCAVAGIDIISLIKGAEAAKNNLFDAYQYAIVRDKFYRNNRLVEAFVVYEEKLQIFIEWLKQLYAETQGKDNKAILPISMINTRDLHSLGQYMQEGSNIVFETHLYVEKKPQIFIEKYNCSLSKVESEALESVCISHYREHTPSVVITLDELTAYNVGYLIFFNFIASCYGAYLLNVNYYDQPGVNGYKDILKERLEQHNADK